MFHSCPVVVRLRLHAAGCREQEVFVLVNVESPIKMKSMRPAIAERSDNPALSYWLICVTSVLTTSVIIVQQRKH